MKTITIRINDSEAAQIEQIKEILNLKGQFGEDSRAIKGALNFGVRNTPSKMSDAVTIMSLLNSYANFLNRFFLVNTFASSTRMFACNNKE